MTTPNTETVKGFQDFSGEEAEKREAIKKILQETFEKYGFLPEETPIIEYEDFVKSNSNNNSNENDEAISDVFKLTDKGERRLALRYEFTFQLKRLIQNKKLPYKRYQIGPVFRDEPTQGNRLRQFTQCDIDIVGSTIKDEAEILAMTKEILDKLKIKSVIYINNRKLMNEILDKFNIKQKEQVLREIDKYDKLPEKQIIQSLKKYNADKLIKELKKEEKFFKQFKSYKEILELIKYCKNYGIKVQFSPTIVRGLSYYNGSVFEIKTEKIKETICAGGSYLINEIQSTGISFGLERLSLVAKIQQEKNKILIISLNQDKKSVELAKKLRERRKIVSIIYGKPSKALEFANAYNYKEAIFIGEDEVKKKKFKIKDLKTGKEKLINEKELMK